MKNLLTKNELIAFEEEIATDFNNALIKLLFICTTEMKIV